MTDSFKQIKTLFALELKSLFGINKALHTKDEKIKKRYLLLTVVWIFLIGMAFTYVGALVTGLCSIGMKEIVSEYLAVIASALILFFGIFSAGAKIFGQKGYHLLVSMPVKPTSIVVSRFLSMYTADLIFALVIMLPGIAVYGYLNSPSPLFYVTAFIGTLFIPAIPLVISTLIGTLVYAISSRLKSKSLVQTLLTVAVVVGVMLFSFLMESGSESMTPEQVKELASTVSALIAKIYLPAVWFGSAVMRQDWLSLLLFVGVSLVVVALTVLIVAKCFNAIILSLFSFSAKHDYKMSAMKNGSVLKALYLREAKRYFSSSIYVTNTIIGPILGVILSVALCVAGLENVTGSLPVGLDIVSIAPFVLSAVFCMMTTTSTSISMEGKHFWAIKSMPVKTKTLLDAKILLNLSIMLPFYVISTVALGIAIKPNPLELISLIVIPVAIILFSTVFGIFINLKFHNFDWEQEATVVKQSASAFLGGFAGALLSVILGVITLLVPSRFSLLVKSLLIIVALALTAIMYIHNNKTKLEEL